MKWVGRRGGRAEAECMVGGWGKGWLIVSPRLKASLKADAVRSTVNCGMGIANIFVQILRSLRSGLGDLNSMDLLA